MTKQWDKRAEWMLHNAGLLNEWALEWKPRTNPPLIEFLRQRVDAAVLPDEPTTRPFKPGDRVMVGPPECETFGTVLTVGSERAQVKNDNGAVREPLLSILRHAENRD